MFQVVSICFDRSEGYSAQSVYLEDALTARLVCNYEDVRFFADTDLIANRVDFFALAVCVEGEVVKSSVCESVAFIFSILLTTYESHFCKIRYALMNIATISKARELTDQFRGYNFVIFAPTLNLWWGQIMMLK